MQIKEYVGRILSSISANPYVESQSISYQERPPHGAYLSGLIAFIDGSQLHVKEFAEGPHQEKDGVAGEPTPEFGILLPRVSKFLGGLVLPLDLPVVSGEA